MGEFQSGAGPILGQAAQDLTGRVPACDRTDQLQQRPGAPQLLKGHTYTPVHAGALAPPEPAPPRQRTPLAPTRPLFICGHCTVLLRDKKGTGFIPFRACVCVGCASLTRPRARHAAPMRPGSAVSSFPGLVVDLFRPSSGDDREGRLN